MVNIHTQSTKEIAKNCYITTNTRSSDGLTVGELVSYGRFHIKRVRPSIRQDKKRLIGL